MEFILFEFWNLKFRVWELEVVETKHDGVAISKFELMLDTVVSI